MIESQSVSSTLYVPLIGNIYTSKNFKQLLYDKKALALESSIPDIGIAEASSQYAYLASASRYYNIDKEIKSFIEKYPNCNIVNLGAGLDTSYYRIASKTAVFYEIDLPPVIKERRKILPEQANDRYISHSFLDVNDWVGEIEEINKPTLLIMGGLFHYFKNEEVSCFFRQIKNKLSVCEAVFDCVSRKGLNISNKYVKKTGNHNAEMHFYIDDINIYLASLNLNITLMEEYMMFRDARQIVKNDVSLKTNLSMWWSDRFKMVKMEHLRMKS